MIDDTEPDDAAAFAALKPTLEACYEHHWQLLFGAHAALAPATLEVRDDGNMDAGYSKALDLLRISVSGWDLYDGDAEEPVDWPAWKQDILHELCHEYQFKVCPVPTHVSDQLAFAFADRFPGAGHDSQFFAAIEVLAARLCRPPDVLASVLASAGGRMHS